MTYVLPNGLQLRHVLGSTWELLSIDGKHVHYLVAEDVDYDGRVRRLR
jgi:hypothetical protein